MEAGTRPTIGGAVLRDDTILRLGGIGDCWPMTWAADDRQLVAFCDGAGFAERPQHFYNSRLHTIAGGPHDARFEDVATYPDLEDGAGEHFSETRYYGFGTLAVDGRVYHALSTTTGRFDAERGVRFNAVKLIFSPDGGTTWCNQDGSSPVTWEPWDGRGEGDLLFADEPQETFSLLTFLQMGRDYAANADGCVYVYSPNGTTDGTMNELVLLRVPKEQVLDRGAYEYFAGLDADGDATWSGEIDARAVVHTFPRGWVNTMVHPWGWSPSVVYDEPLGVYLMANWGTGPSADGMWFGKPSYLGLWTAPQPWGPWTQILEQEAWTPGGDPAARCYKPQIAPKWIAPDGKSFWLVWTDFQTVGGVDFMEEFHRLLAGDADPDVTESGMHPTAALHRKLVPYFGFNAQRVDLLLD